MICSDVLWFLTSGVSKDFITQSARTGTTFFVLKSLLFLCFLLFWAHSDTGTSFRINTDLCHPLWQILRFCGPMVPVYTAVTLLLACGGQLSTILKTRRAADMSQVVGKGLQPHKVNLPVYILHILLRYASKTWKFILDLGNSRTVTPPPSSLSCSWFQEVWSGLCLPLMDSLPPTTPDATFNEDAVPAEEWPHFLSPLLYIFGAAVAYWGSALLRLMMRLVSLVLAPLHRWSWRVKTLRHLIWSVL